MFWRSVALGVAIVLYAFLAYVNFADFIYAMSANRPPTAYETYQSAWTHASGRAWLLIVALAGVSAATIPFSRSLLPLRSNVVLLAVIFALPVSLAALCATDDYMANGLKTLAWVGGYVPIGVWTWKRQGDVPPLVYVVLAVSQGVLLVIGVALTLGKAALVW